MYIARSAYKERLAYKARDASLKSTWIDATLVEPRILFSGSVMMTCVSDVFYKHVVSSKHPFKIYTEDHVKGYVLSKVFKIRVR